MMLEITSQNALNFLPHKDLDPKELPNIPREALKRHEKVLNENQAQLEKPFPFGPEGTNPANILAEIAEKQRHTVISMWSSYSSEAAIAMVLRSAIGAYAEQLEAIKRWTNGGEDMMDEALRLIFEKLKGKGDLSGTEMEDMFQVVLMDIMLHAEEYGPGIKNILNDKDQMTLIKKFLGNFGTGSHVDLNNGEGQIEAKGLKNLFNKIFNALPEGSLAKDAMNSMKPSAPDVFNDIIENYSSDTNGWYDHAPGEESHDHPGMSTLMRISLLRAAIQEGSVSQEDLKKILTGSPEELDNMFNGDPFKFLADNDDKWQIWDSGNWIGPDFDGVGADLDYLETIIHDFPPRELTNEELEEVNRIGDIVKMINETLKYWINTLRDERLSIARNI